MNYRNPVFTASGAINVEIEHPVYGWIPFTASPDDPEQHGRELFEALKTEAAAYVAPEPKPEQVPTSVHRRQAKQQLLADGLLDQVQPAIDAITDPIERGMVQIYWDDADRFDRQSPELISIGTALGLTSDQIDTMFKEAVNR